MIRRRTAAEAGSITIWFVMLTMTFALIIGVAYDLGGQVQTKQRADDVAAQAARAGGQQLNAAAAIHGDDIAVDVTAAVQAAKTYLAASGMTGDVQVVAGTHLVVTVQATYDNKILPGGRTVTGEATARIVRVVGGVEQ